MKKEKENQNEAVDYLIYLKLNIYSDELTPDEISNILCMSPTKSFKCGDPVSWGKDLKKCPLVKQTLWCVRPSVSDVNSSVSEQYESFYSLVYKNSLNFKKLANTYEVSIEIGCVVYAYKYVPEIRFTPKQMNFFSRMSANLYISVYDLTE